jgi:DNA transformation protein and related proteins
MSESRALIAYALDLFGGMGAVEARRLFGGAGLYAGPTMFGLIYGGRIYLKTDEALARALTAEGAEPWVYMRRGEPQPTSYLSLPSAAEDDPEEACAWGRRALAIAELKKAAAPPKRRRR